MLQFKILVLAATLTLSTNPYLIDFGKEKGGSEWNVIVDGVMGGLSTGKATFTDNTVQFTGNLSLENNGGFSSYRMPFGLRHRRIERCLRRN